MKLFIFNTGFIDENKAVLDYIYASEFPLYQMLLKEMTKYGIFRKQAKSYKYEAEWKTKATQEQVNQLRQSKPQVKAVAMGQCSLIVDK